MYLKIYSVSGHIFLCVHVVWYRPSSPEHICIYRMTIVLGNVVWVLACCHVVVKC